MKSFFHLVTLMGLWLIVISTLRVQAEPCDEDDPNPDCWKLQSGDRPLKPGDPCQVVIVESHLDINNQTLILDPCTDEENRSFMECVLTYEPDPSKHDNKGTCQCYREWNHWLQASTRTPAYNHSLNMQTASEEWFVFDEGFDECAIKPGKRCAPIGTVIVPYRCQNMKDKEDEIVEQWCNELDLDDSYFLICSDAPMACSPVQFLLLCLSTLISFKSRYLFAVNI